MSSKDTPTDEPTQFDEADKDRQQRVKEELKAEWDRRLRACFDAPDFGDKVDAVMDARGRTKVRPKAGSTY